MAGLVYPCKITINISHYMRRKIYPGGAMYQPHRKVPPLKLCRITNLPRPVGLNTNKLNTKLKHII